MPGLSAPARHFGLVRSSTWLAATTATFPPRTVVTYGAYASLALRPKPTTGIGEESLAARVSARPSTPKSTAWLLAIETTSTPESLSADSALGEVRKVYVFGSGAPRPVIA